MSKAGKRGGEQSEGFGPLFFCALAAADDERAPRTEAPSLAHMHAQLVCSLSSCARSVVRSFAATYLSIVLLLPAVCMVAAAAPEPACLLPKLMSLEVVTDDLCIVCDEPMDSLVMPACAACAFFCSAVKLRVLAVACFCPSCANEHEGELAQHKHSLLPR